MKTAAVVLLIAIAVAASGYAGYMLGLRQSQDDPVTNAICANVYGRFAFTSNEPIREVDFVAICAQMVKRGEWIPGGNGCDLVNAVRVKVGYEKTYC